MQRRSPPHLLTGFYREAQGTSLRLFTLQAQAQQGLHPRPQGQGIFLSEVCLLGRGHTWPAVEPREKATKAGGSEGYFHLRS